MFYSENYIVKLTLNAYKEYAQLIKHPLSK